MFFERPESGTKTLLVHIQQNDSELATVSELRELVVAAGLEPVACIESRRKDPHPGTYIGAGKLEEIAKVAIQVDAALIVFDEDLSPTQERNIEKELGRRVLSRTGLILEIFALRARTHEGKLQVELAQLQHASTRLVRGWTHLDRQRGGSGRGQGSSAGLGGAGEKQLEADKRMLSDRIKKINRRLGKVHRQRSQNRKARKRSDVKSVSLAGYTNAGKSTLFNRLAQADVHVADQLFATLDPTLRCLELPLVGEVIVSDTVGFIRKLPHTLVDAFSATLEEVTQANLILHVVDASAPERQERIEEVNRVLAEIDAQVVPQLLVYNKSDLVAKSPTIERDRHGKPVRVWVSALAGEGMNLLSDCLAELLAEDIVETTITLAPDQGRLRAQLFESGIVVSESTDEEGKINLELRIEQRNLERLTGVKH
ncbi:MAG: GTPase HflX [Gammaproteobacteria bacterium]|nr:GTPase HflX [Gammaproteobacteria bacterium]